MTVVGADGLARPQWAAVDPLLMEYYDTEWGVPIRDERGLYERICLEGFQAGLSWSTILRIIRHRGKIQATITNARATLALREEVGLVDFVWSFQPSDTPRPLDYSEVPTVSDESKALSKALRKKGFAFVGPTTMYALMEAVGIVDTHLMTSHRRGSSGVWPT